MRPRVRVIGVIAPVPFLLAIADAPRTLTCGELRRSGSG